MGAAFRRPAVRRECTTRTTTREAREHGFTLVEVLVALVIVAAGAAAVLAALNTAADSAGYLRDRMFANWIASNRLVEVRLASATPSNGTTRGELDYAGERWGWQQTIDDTLVPGVRRVTIQVRRGPVPASDEAPTDWTATIDGALGRDVARRLGNVPDWNPPAQTGGGGTPQTPGSAAPGQPPAGPAAPGSGTPSTAPPATPAGAGT
jgi:general secretion pathway protein I